MTEPDPNPESYPLPNPAEAEGEPVPVRSLRELLDKVTGRGIMPHEMDVDAGLAEALPFPFLAIVGQREMKLALLLALVNPAVGGVLLIGPRGTGKTTAVRSLADLLPHTYRSLCYYGCMPEDVETGGIDSVCPDCARKYAMGEPLARMDSVRLVELPLNARLVDVVGGLDERAAIHNRLRVQRGILSRQIATLRYWSRFLPETCAKTAKKSSVVTLVNLSATEPRTVVVQGGAYGEHQFASVEWAGKKEPINARDFTVLLAPGAGARLTLALRRYANAPTVGFPWNRKG